jgi:hypothetical protein
LDASDDAAFSYKALAADREITLDLQRRMEALSDRTFQALSIAFQTGLLAFDPKEHPDRARAKKRTRRACDGRGEAHHVGCETDRTGVRRNERSADHNRVEREILMQLTILKIILWPKDTAFRPRVIPFEPGKINIISGESGTGKSTLTWIVDYCLGSDKCSIPVGLIRDLAGWFGLHLKLANTGDDNRAAKSRGATNYNRPVLERRPQP